MALSNNTNHFNNRVLEALLASAKQEMDHRLRNPAITRHDPAAQAIVRTHYDSILQSYGTRRDLSRDERATLRYIRHTLRRMRVRELPILPKLTYLVASFLIRGPVKWRPNISAHQEHITKAEKNVVMSKNLSQLSDRLREQGFTHIPEQALKDNLQHELPKFSIRYADEKFRNIDYVLNFEKRPGADAWHFAGFSATNRPTLQDTIQKTPTNAQLLFNNLDKLKFTAQDAGHMMDGRPIIKEVNSERKWFSYNGRQLPIELPSKLKVPAALDELPLKELANPTQRANLIRKLEQGEKCDVTLLMPDNRTEKITIHITRDALSVSAHKLDGSYVVIADYIQRLNDARQKQAAKKTKQTKVEQPSIRPNLGW